MTKTLELLFLDAADKQVKLSINNLNQDVSENLLRDNMQKLITLDILRPSNQIPVKIKGAQILNKTTNVIFTNNK